MEIKLKQKEKTLSEKCSETLLKQICDIKYKLNEICNKKAEFAIFRLKTNFYESGEKSGKQKEATYVISGIKVESGQMVTTSLEIFKRSTHICILQTLLLILKKWMHRFQGLIFLACRLIKLKLWMLQLTEDEIN